MRIEWLGIAEGAVVDGRGAFTVVGLNMNLVIAEKLPVPFVRSVILLVETDRTLDADDEVSISFQLTDPTGKVMSASNATSKVAPPISPESPAFIQLIAQLGGVAREYGAYSIACDVQVTNREPLKATKRIFVVPPPIAAEAVVSTVAD